MIIRGGDEETGISLRQLLSQEDFEVLEIAHERWLDNQVRHPRTQRPGLAIAGYTRYLDSQRLQVMGKTEMGYLGQLPLPEQEKRVKAFLACRIPGLVVSEGQLVPDFMATHSGRYHIPVIRSRLRASLLIPRISRLLYAHFSQKIRLNGVLMDVMGVGTLITGDSGIGKSETALELLNKGHPLIGDDLIEFYLDSNDDPVGRSIEPIRRWLEVRGLGIINIVDMFGVGAQLKEKTLEFVVKLEKWSPKKRYDRLGEENLFFQVLGKDIPMVVLPVAPGRNLSTLIEVAVKYFISRRNGSQSFVEHIYAKDGK